MLTQALARGSAKRPWTTIGLWLLALIIAGVLVAAFLSDALTTKFEFTNTPEAQRGVDLLEELRGVPISTNEVVIVQSDSRTVDDPAFREVVTDMHARLAALGPEIIREGTLANYYQTGAGFLISADRRTTLIPLTMAGDFDDATANIDRVLEVVDAARPPDGFQVLVTGQATTGVDFQELSQDGIEKGETFGVPVALIVLVLVFGALVAALVPLVLALVSIVVALGVASVVGQAFALSFFVTNIIFMIGLAVGIDYSLFIVARYREERARGLAKLDAIERAGATASRAVLFSGLTVFLALIGMLLVPFNVFVGLGIGAILVVIASVLTALTLLPAILSLMGDRVNWLTVPWIGRVQARLDESRPGGFWDVVSRNVMRQPLISIFLGGGLLIAAAIPAFDLSTGFAGISTMPDNLQSKQGFVILDEKFSAGDVTPAVILIEGNGADPRVQASLEALKADLAGDPAFGPPRPLEVSSNGNLAALTLMLQIGQPA